MESIEYNGRKIEYSIIRKNVVNINLRVKRDGAVVVSASPVVPKEVIHRFVAENADKILSAINKNKSQNAALSFEDGCRIMLLGRAYRLVLEKSSADFYFISEDNITFYVKDINDAERKQSIYNTLLKNTADIVFPKLIKECYGPFNSVCREIPSLKIKNLKSQWGNCYHKRNLITLNAKLAAYDLNVIKSVVYHEYCHFVYQNHSKDFYHLLTAVYPNWKTYDRILKNKK